MHDVWDENWWGSTKTLDVHVASLRKKLRPRPDRDGARRRVPARGPLGADAMTRRLLASYLLITVLALVLLEVPLAVFFAQRERERIAADLEHDATVIATLYEDDLENDLPLDPAAGDRVQRPHRRTGGRRRPRRHLAGRHRRPRRSRLLDPARDRRGAERQAGDGNPILGHVGNRHPLRRGAGRVRRNGARRAARHDRHERRRRPASTASGSGSPPSPS